MLSRTATALLLTRRSMKLKSLLSTFQTDGATVELQDILSMARHPDVAEAERKFNQHRAELDELVAAIAAD
ncbi:hypothetical protein [Rubripirellula reticaptiva]|uniref:Uncharacterized protein n=1 Tax=Rubripirellula reticaptiva TaxID=2528013 RepID=A0A5C6FBU0_9BACT|nr:hypothetical protein [Rubripirellula reticaptiva]TWU58252.1 hypothetical protein Poly59_11630 [Rubripirellula reticaptiva]